MTNLTRRLERIESERNPGGVIVAKQACPDEPNESVRKRWEADNPGRTWRDSDLVVILRRFAFD